MEKVDISEVIEWAKQFLAQSEKEITNEERKEQQKYAILVQKAGDKILLSKLLDESSQIRNNKKLAHRMKVLIDRYGVPEFFLFCRQDFDQTVYCVWLLVRFYSCSYF